MSDIVFAADGIGITLSGDVSLNGNVFAAANLSAPAVFTTDIVSAVLVPGTKPPAEDPTVATPITLHANQLDMQFSGATRTVAHWTELDVLVMNEGGGFHGGVLIEGPSTTVMGNLLSFYLTAQTVSAESITGTFEGTSELRLICDRLTMTVPLPSGDGPVRQLLARTNKDALVINEGASFSGGVLIDGNVDMPGSLNVHRGVTVGGVVIEGAGSSHVLPTTGPFGPLIHSQLVISNRTIVVKTITQAALPTVTPGGVHLPAQTIEADLDLVAEIHKLRADVEALKAKVK